jgi:hypothetical protein
MPRTRGSRPIKPSERRLPRGIAQADKSPDKCSRCGKPAESPYICNGCKSALTVESRQLHEVRDPAYLAARRKQRRDHMRRKREK